jgi:hypothetical protein
MTSNKSNEYFRKSAMSDFILPIHDPLKGFSFNYTSASYT